jgi:hypothetical protein
MAKRTSGGAKRKTATPRKRWSAQVMQRSNALDLEEGVFKGASAEASARSLKRSAEASRRRKSDPYRSAMSMLTFYINRGGEPAQEQGANPGAGERRVARPVSQAAPQLGLGAGRADCSGGGQCMARSDVWRHAVCSPVGDIPRRGRPKPC